MYNSTNISCYSQFTENHWKNAANRRAFFIKFATLNGFDPLVSENWENIKTVEMIKQVEKYERKE